MARSPKKSSRKRSRATGRSAKPMSKAPKGAKTVVFEHCLALPVERVHEVLTSERYLLTLDGMDPAVTAANKVVSARTETFDSGTVQAVVVMHPVPPAPEGGWGSNEARAAAEAEAAKNEVAQVTRVTQLQDDTCTMSAVLPLTNGIGEILSSFEFSAADAAESGGATDIVSDVETEQPYVKVVASLTIAVKISAVRTQFEQAFLARAEDTVVNGLRRIERLAATEETL